MTTPTRIEALMQAFSFPLEKDAVTKPLSPQQWSVLDGYLMPVQLSEGEALFQRGRLERSLYLMESGRVTIHYENAKGVLRMGFVSAGSVFGEASFLGDVPRLASAKVAVSGKAWMLSRLKFVELHKREPDLALDVVQLAATVLAKRSRDPRRRRVIA